MSFTDKLSNGVAVMMIQALHPCRFVHTNTHTNTLFRGHFQASINEYLLWWVIGWTSGDT